MIYLDTHSVLFLYERNVERFSEEALRTIDEDDDIRISPMVLLELEFLHEIKRIRSVPRTIIAGLSDELGLKVCDAPFHAVVERGVQERWTRDPFDRLIVAQARLAQAVLVTKDRVIHRHYGAAIS